MADTTINELSALRIYIEDAIRRADPTLDTGAGSPLDRELITPLLERLGPDPYDTPIEDFIRARIVSENPELSVQAGEPIDDYLITPSRIILEPFRRMIQQVKQNQSIADPEILSDEEADNLGANWFVRRREGQYSSGPARIYFTAPQGALVTPSNPVFTSGDLRFYPVDNQAITSDSMLFNVEGSLYYFDIIVRAETQGSQYDIEENTLIGIEGIPSVVKVTNKIAFSGGGDREDTVTYLARVESSLTERSLVTNPGILARLTDIFDSLRIIQVIGAGDPEMARDILTGSDEAATYAHFMGTVVGGGSQDIIELYDGGSGNEISDGNPEHNDFVEAAVEVGDTVNRYDIDPSSGTYGEVFEASVTEVLSATQIRVSPTSPFVGTYLYQLKRATGQLRISDIPGGILEPQTPNGDVIINDGEVHIGSMYDVFVRGGDPPDRSIELSAIRDQRPLHFGVDLESFGEDDDIFINVTGLILYGHIPSLDINGVALTTYDNLLVNPTYSSTEAGWVPSSEDIGRYIQFQGYSGLYGTFEIVEVLGKERYGGQDTFRIRLDLLDQDSGVSVSGFPLSVPGFNAPYKIREKVSVKSLVRDRDNTRVPIGQTKGAGTDYDSLGTEIGDSVVIENGDDAGVYSVRRVLTSIDDNDTLVLDRELTKTSEPSGLGDGSGLRYRINDELDVDLVDPKVTKIPLGVIFAGDDMSVVAGSDTVSVFGDTNFLLAGAAIGDTLEILSGSSVGRYGVLEVTGTTMRVDGPMLNTESPVSFSLYTEFDGADRPLVRVKEIELLDSASQPTGLKIPYGDVVDIRVLGTLSNRNEGTNVESYEGEATESGGEFILEDYSVDFAAQGVLPEDRLVIIGTSNAGNYTIKEVAPLAASPSWLKVYKASEGGKDFQVYPKPDTHYTVGRSSTGWARMYFLEPTSVEVDTGMSGARLLAGDYEFRFSDVVGHNVLPAPGSGSDDLPRDIKTIYSSSAGNESIVELVDPDHPDVFEMEIQVGDVLDVYQQVLLRDSGGIVYESLGISGTPVGLQTVLGSNRVKIPANSSLDFIQTAQAGQLLYIEDGPDAGRYTIEEVIDAKTLRLDKIMTSSTATVVSRDYSAPAVRDAELSDAGGGSAWLKDVTDTSALGTQVGYYITIFDTSRPSLSGTYEIEAIDTPNNRVKLKMSVPSALTPAYHSITWLRTAGEENVMHAFRIYEAVPEELEVTEVSVKEEDTDLNSPSGVYVGIGSTSLYSGNLVKLTASGVNFSANVTKGDRLEVLFGDNAGVYTVEGVIDASNLYVYANNPFVATETNVWFRVRGGVHGSRRMLRLGPYEGSGGYLSPGEMMPYRIRRPGTYRLSSTEMQDNFDGSLYYADLIIESEGAGDGLNLAENTRLEKVSGIRVDGYVYHVDNNVLTFSPYELVDLYFTRRFLPVGNSDQPDNLTEISGRNLKITYETSTIARILNDLLRSDADRVVCSNPICRHFLPSYLLTTVTYSGGASASDTGDSAENFVNNLGPEDELEVSDLEAIFTRLGANYVEHPILLVSVTHDLDRNLVAERSENKIGGTSVPYNGTARISSFFAKVGEGLNVVRQS